MAMAKSGDDPETAELLLKLVREVQEVRALQHYLALQTRQAERLDEGGMRSFLPYVSIAACTDATVDL